MLSVLVFLNGMVWEILPTPTLLYLGEAFKIVCITALLFINRIDHLWSSVAGCSTLLLCQIFPIIYLILHRATAANVYTQSPPVNLLLTSFSIVISSFIAIWMLTATVINQRRWKQQQGLF